MTLEKISRFQIGDDDTYISKFATEINDFLADSSRKKLTYKAIKNWLVQNGYMIESEPDEKGKRKRKPTELGKEVGFRVEERLSREGWKYEVVIIDKTAKEFMIQHINEIAESVGND